MLGTADPAFETIDLSALPASKRDEQLQHLVKGGQVRSSSPESGPILTVKFATLGSNRSALVVGLPAMSADRGSLLVLVRDLEQFARGLPANAAEDPLRYVQFAQWQNDLAEGVDEASTKGREFWAKNFPCQTGTKMQAVFPRSRLRHSSTEQLGSGLSH